MKPNASLGLLGYAIANPTYAGIGFREFCQSLSPAFFVVLHRLRGSAGKPILQVVSAIVLKHRGYLRYFTGFPQED
ncbi:MAG: hypothetical protein HC866_09660 [Leptolyngbyaceae cyanobacterium RU_5_1]|nr:hypothetical protein [Leptolyngbyaceae cyanobacterium RU_5_1]